MKLKQCILVGWMAFFSISVKGQSLEKTYRGQWGSSFWTFEFHSNNRYSHTSDGHYGHTIVEGVYRIHNDTLELINGFENSSGTVNRYYLIDGKRIIDLEILYDYYEQEGFPISWKNKRIKEKQANGKQPRYRYEPELIKLIQE